MQLFFFLIIQPLPDVFFFVFQVGLLKQQMEQTMAKTSELQDQLDIEQEANKKCGCPLFQETRKTSSFWFDHC